MHQSKRIIALLILLGLLTAIMPAFPAAATISTAVSPAVTSSQPEGQATGPAQVHTATHAATRAPKNVIIMIADGCGYNQIAAADYYQYGVLGRQVYDRFPVKVAMSTYSIDDSYNPGQAWSDFDYVKSNYTDSAAAATAMSTGVKTYDAAIGVDEKQQYQPGETTEKQITDQSLNRHLYDRPHRSQISTDTLNEQMHQSPTQIKECIFMKNKMIKAISTSSAILILSASIAGCTAAQASSGTATVTQIASAASAAANLAASSASTATIETPTTTTTTTTTTATGASLIDTTDLFSARDLEQLPDLTGATIINLASGQDVTLTDEGIYVLRGEATDVTVVVEAAEDAKVQIVLDGVSITNQDAPAIYVKTADKVFVTTTDSQNTMNQTSE